MQAETDRETETRELPLRWKTETPAAASNYPFHYKQTNEANISTKVSNPRSRPDPGFLCSLALWPSVEERIESEKKPQIA